MRMCSPSQTSNTTAPRSSRVRKPKVSAMYVGWRRMGMIGLSAPCRMTPFSSVGSYDPNHELSFGTTVLSSEKRINTRFSKDARLSAYVSLMLLTTSLLIEARNSLTSRYVSSWFGSRKYCACKYDRSPEIYFQQRSKYYPPSVADLNKVVLCILAVDTKSCSSSSNLTQNIARLTQWQIGNAHVLRPES